MGPHLLPTGLEPSRQAKPSTYGPTAFPPGQTYLRAYSLPARPNRSTTSRRVTTLFIFHDRDRVTHKPQHVTSPCAAVLPAFHTRHVTNKSAQEGQAGPTECTDTHRTVTCPCYKSAQEGQAGLTECTYVRNCVERTFSALAVHTPAAEGEGEGHILELKNTTVLH